VAHAESVWQFRDTVMDVVTRTALIYHELLFARENLEVEVRSRSLAQRLLDDNTQRAEIGVMSPST
jgi:outer membrane protein TolC